MADTKIRTNRLNVATLVKNILDSSTASAIQSLLSLVPGTNVQAYDANTLTASNTATVTNKRVTPRQVTGNHSSAGTEYVATNLYDHMAFNLSADITISDNGSPTTGQHLIVVLVSDATPRAVVWDSSKYADTSAFTAMTTTTPSKFSIHEFLYVSGKWRLVGRTDEL
jgi:hypothetical protein